MPAARPGLVDMMPDSFGILHGEGEGAIIAEKINDVSHAETYLKLVLPPMNGFYLVASERVSYSPHSALPILYRT